MKKKAAHKKAARVRRRWAFKPVSRVVESRRIYRRARTKAEERSAREE